MRSMRFEGFYPVSGIDYPSTLTWLIGIGSQRLATEQLATARWKLRLQEDAGRRKLVQEQEKCIQLFYLTNNDRDATYDWYKARVEARVGGTCEWFLNHENFQRWLEEESGPLLVSADPGCGKSVLAKYLVDHRLPRSASIGYFFFKEQDQNTVRQALCTLLHQLFSQNRPLTEHVLTQYKTDGGADQLPKVALDCPAKCSSGCPSRTRNFGLGCRGRMRRVRV